MNKYQKVDPIIQTVNTYGFCCTEFKEVISGLEMIKLPLYLNVSFEGQIGMNPVRPKHGIYKTTGMGEINQNMNHWVPLLKYEYIPLKVTGNEEIDEWYYIDYENISTTMKFDIYLYYRKISIEKGIKYYIINDNGYIVKLGWEGKNHYQRAWVPNVIYSDQQLKEQNNIIIKK